jgi:hypothetical protein
MQAFMPFIKEAAISGLLPLLQERSYRVNFVGLGFVIFALPLSAAAFIFFALAIYSILAPLYGAATAFIWAGVLLILLAGGSLYTGARLLQERRPSQPLYTPQEISLMVDTMTRDIETEVAGTVQENPKTSLAVAAMAGFLAGKGIFYR